jgi:dTDP-4-amino-4,6-dideoxygalactose transaminase
MLDKLPEITERRRQNATSYDRLLRSIPQIQVPPRRDDVKHVFHLYIVRADRRDELQQHLIAAGIDAKVHYPKPMHLQPAASDLGHERGDFPVAEAVCDSVLSLPVHEFITAEQIEHVVEKVRQFYAG